MVRRGAGRIVQIRRSELAAAIRRGDVDFAIARPVSDAPDLVQTQIAEEGVVAAVADSHPLARRESIANADLDGLPLVLLERQIWPDVYDELLATLREQGVRPSGLHHASAPTAALAMVAAGHGVFRMGASAAVPWQGVTFVPIEDARVPVILVRRPGPTRPVVAAAIAKLGA